MITLLAMRHDPLLDSPFGSTVQVVESAVLEAARYLQDAATSGVALQVNVKADKTMVMNLDLESQRRILEKLPKDVPIVAEEDESSHSLITKATSYFLVDPLDGTTSCKRFFGQKGGHVGYGPLVGYVHEGALSVASFYNVPHDKLFTAVRGHGVYVSTPEFSAQPSVGRRERLVPTPCASLHQAGMLFFIGHNGEARVVQHLKNHNAVENNYRFGGFANDCSRLAEGHEQMSMQFTVKPWDFSAVLLVAEAGLEVYMDPLGRRVPLDTWRIEANNPIMTMHPGFRDELFTLIDKLA